MVGWLTWGHSLKSNPVRGKRHCRGQNSVPLYGQIGGRIPTLDAPKKSRVSPAALTEVETALREYVREVLQVGYGAMSLNLHVDYADKFVRWLKYEFTPGERLDKPKAK